jgi:hypothetical protein
MLLTLAMTGYHLLSNKNIVNLEQNVTRFIKLLFAILLS